jgi:hypothetical protein
MNPHLARYATDLANGARIDLWDGFVIEAIAQLRGASPEARSSAMAALREVVESEPAIPPFDREPLVLNNESDRTWGASHRCAATES